MMRSFFLWGSRNEWMKERLPRYRFVQRAVTRFMPGESADEALAESERLGGLGISSVLTLLGENVETEAEASAVADHYLSVLDAVEERGTDAELSIKLTQLGLDLGSSVAERNLERVVHRAAEFGKFVWVDMEDSSYVDVTLDTYEKLRRENNNVGVCLQAYLYRTPADLERLLPLEPTIRLVKGAYAELPDVAHPKKRDVDKAYLELAGVLLERLHSGNDGRAGFATHDPVLIERIKHEAERRGLPRDVLEFQMLYGIGRQRQEQLARDGYPMRVLISYGSAWFPWYMRRLAERPANVWFVARSLFAK